MSLFPTMPLPAVSAWIDHFLRLAVGDCESLRQENLDLRADRAALDEELAEGRRKIAALEINLALERALNRSKDDDVARLSYELAGARARIRALEGAAGARLNAYCRLEDVAQRLRCENIELRAALTSEAAQ